jgi:CRP-like cAMP-binding protein
MNVRSRDTVHPSPEAVGAIPVFAGLSPAELRLIASWFGVETRDEGALLTQEGTPGYWFYVLVEGTATVMQGDLAIRRLGPGDFFGERAIFELGDRTATVRATSPVVVWNMFGRRFLSLEARFPAVAETIRAKYL